MKDNMTAVSNKGQYSFNRIHAYIMFAVITAFYLGLFFVYGVALCDDSNGYIRMISAREPVYPLYLAFFRKIVGLKHYLSVAVFFQNILMIYAVYSLIKYLMLRYKLRPYMGYLFVAINVGVSALNQFIALRGAAYSNSIETEALAIPLWLIFFRLLFKFIDTNRSKYIWQMALLTGLMMDIRKQMAIGFVLMFAVTFIVFIGRKHYLRKLLVTVVAIVISFLLAGLVTRVYNYCLRGTYASNTRDMNLVLTTSLYIADPEDEKLIEDKASREVFMKTMEILDKEEIIYNYAGSSLSELNAHYVKSFDKITIDTTANLFIDFAVDNGFSQGMEAEAEADRMSKVIVKSLFMDNLGKYAKVYMSSMYDGLINTVAKRHPLLDIYAMLAFLAYIGLGIACFIKKRTRTIAYVAIAVFFGIMINVGSTAAFIFCQTRYMIYNMPLFYMVILIMLYGLIYRKEDFSVKPYGIVARDRLGKDSEESDDIKKIAIIGPVYPYKGGIAHYTGLMTKAFKKKYDTSCISYSMQYPKIMFKKEQRDYSNKTFEIEDAQFLINTANPINWIISAYKIRKMNPDLIITQWWHPYFAPCYQWILGSLEGYRNVYINHNVLPHERFPLDRWLTKGTLSYGDYAIVHSKLDEDDLKKLLPKMKYSRTVIPTYSAFKLRDITREEARKELGIEENEKMLLFFGLVRKYKGLPYLIKAMPKVIEEYPDIKLYVVGDFAGHKDEYMELIKENKVENNIVIRDGYVPDEEIQPYYTAADICVCPYESATQSAIVQVSFGFNLPVIATNVGGLPEVVTDGKTGYVVESMNPDALAEAIIKFYKEDKQKEFINNVIEESPRFSWDHMVEVIEELVLNGRN